MAFLGVGELERAIAAANRLNPQPKMLYLVPPALPQYREGSFTVPSRPAFDNRVPAFPVSQWTPWGWASPTPGGTMENF
jgi:hypothetical protein